MSGDGCIPLSVLKLLMISLHFDLQVALVFFIHQLTRILETNSYVRCFLVDFSKAFDVIDHSIIATKLEQLN